MGSAKSRQAPQPSVCYWNKLPTELKIHIFSYLDLVDENEKEYSCDKTRKHREKFKTLCLTNKEFQALAQEIWFKGNTYFSRRETIDVSSETRDTSLVYPNPRFGHLVRNLHLELIASYRDSLDSLLDTSQMNDWGYLLRPRSTPSSSRSRKTPRWISRSNTTKWQDSFQFLDNLKISLWIYQGACIEHFELKRALLIDMLLETEIAIRAKRVRVVIHLYYDHKWHRYYHHSAEGAMGHWLIAEVIQNMIKKPGK